MRISKSLLLAALIIAAPAAFAAETLEATVYKNPSCGCCGNYIRYLQANGFKVYAIDDADVEMIKDRHHIPLSMRSCHTALIGGYVVEGHVPVASIRKLLKEHPKIEGIALPGMPPTSPGMGPGEPGSLTVYVLGGDYAAGQVFSVE